MHTSKEASPVIRRENTNKTAGQSLGYLGEAMTSKSEYEKELAEFAATLSIDDIPDEVIDHAGTVVADTIGAIIGGMTTDTVSEFASLASDRHPGQASLLGTKQQATPTFAAMANGTAGTALEMDEGHKYSAGHPAIHVIPAIIAVAEDENATGEQFLTALVAGYEAGARAGMAVSPIDGDFHMHGSWPVVGGAAGVARYRGLDAETTLHAMRIGAANAMQTVFEAATAGATERNTYAGSACASAIAAVDQAEAGFTGIEDGVVRRLSRMSENTVSGEALIEGLGDRWEVKRGYFKTHAACRYTHGALDIVASVLDGRDLDPDEIDSIDVETYPAAARLVATDPKNPLQAKFSIPFAVATSIEHGHTEKPAFEADAITDRTTALAERVTVTTAADLADRVPDARSTRMRIELRDGTTITDEVRNAKGDERKPFSEPEIREKFDSLVAPVLSAEGADSLWQTAQALPATPVSEIVDGATPSG